MVQVYAERLSCVLFTGTTFEFVDIYGFLENIDFTLPCAIASGIQSSVTILSDGACRLMLVECVNNHCKTNKRRIHLSVVESNQLQNHSLQRNSNPPP